jgi:cephalosporin-C deacetylase-like acetyl esterase
MRSPRRWTLAALALLLHTPAYGQAPAPAAKPEQAAPRRELIAYLDALAFADLDRREAEVARIDTRAAAERRKAETKRTVLGLIGGLPTWRGPLAAKSYGTVEGDGFRVERITYESLPGFRVTANVYLPTTGSGPFPAVLLTAGHDPSGKTGQYSFGANLARAGIAALAYDPISEGERMQYLDPATGASRVGRVTGEHSHAGLQTLLLGDHVSRYFVQDAMRGIDYLASRGDIDASRIGAFGCSGGGTVTAYLAALDDRVKAAATACYITSFRDLLAAGDPQEGEQSIPHFLERGLDLADWVEMAAPKPYAVISTTEDMFPFAGAKRAVEEARRIYGLYGAADRFQWLTAPGRHGAIGPVSGDIVAFFARWLGADTTARTFDPARAPRPAALQVTATGQLASSIGSETLYTLNRKRAAEVLAPKRPIRTPAELERFRARLRADIDTAAMLTVRPGGAPPAVRTLATERRAGYRLETVAIDAEKGIELVGALALPERAGARPALLVMDVRPKEEVAAAGGELDRLARAGWVVLALQPRGTPGGTEESKSPLLGTSYLLSLRAALVGKTLQGMWTDDAIRAVDWLAARPEVDRSAISAYGVGAMGPVALQAAVIDPRIGTVTVEHSLASYRMAVDHPTTQDLPDVALPGVLRRYDIGDLLLAAGPKGIVVVDPVDESLKPVDLDAYRKMMDHVFESDRALGWAGRVEVRSEK